MADFPALPLWTDAYIADTQHLTNEEHGVYLRLLMFAWRTPGCCLPDDDKRLAIMVGVTPKKWTTLKPVIMSFWTLRGGLWVQKKLTSERKFVERSREQKRAAGIASAKAKALKSNEVAPTVVATAVPTETQRDSQQPTPIPTVKVKTEAKASPKKGTRLPDDWTLPKEDYCWAEQAGLDRSRISPETDKFFDYWRAKSGANATKRDWSATWRNWIRNALERQQPNKTKQERISNDIAEFKRERAQDYG